MPDDRDWETQVHDGTDGQPRTVTVHSKIIGGVLCRWWGDEVPPGVALLDSLTDDAGAKP